MQQRFELGDLFANNKLFTSDAVEKARARLKAKFDNLNSSTQPPAAGPQTTFIPTGFGANTKLVTTDRMAEIRKN